jgi:hypothetical protein
MGNGAQQKRRLRLGCDAPGYSDLSQVAGQNAIPFLPSPDLVALSWKTLLAAEGRNSR